MFSELDSRWFLPRRVYARFVKAQSGDCRYGRREGFERRPYIAAAHHRLPDSHLTEAFTWNTHCKVMKIIRKSSQKEALRMYHSSRASFSWGSAIPHR
jgi:hypothetical protein